MTKAGNSQITRTITLLITIFSLSLPAYAQYSGGRGGPNDPYQIATAEDLMLLGEMPEDYDKHFILIADIDLDPNLPGRKVFDRAVIGGFCGIFDGNSHIIKNMHCSKGLFKSLSKGAKISDLGIIDANVQWPSDDVGTLAVGILASSSEGRPAGRRREYGIIRVNNCYTSGIVRGENSVGGLIGWSEGTIIMNCYSTSKVYGEGKVGGLVGYNRYNGHIYNSYATGEVIAHGSMSTGGLVGANESWIFNSYSTGQISGNSKVGGLVGYSKGLVLNSYSTSAVSGDMNIGGLIGENEGGSVTHCYSIGPVHADTAAVGGLIGHNWNNWSRNVIASFFDIETSGQVSDRGLTTEEMIDANTFITAGWDFLGEASNGLHEIWQMPDEGGYPIIRDFNRDSMPMLAGRGIPQDPFLISSAEELGAIMWIDPSASYRLETDVNCVGFHWSGPIIPDFCGMLDGNGFTISQLTLTGAKELGLIGVINFGATVKGLRIVDANIISSGSEVGILAGRHEGLVTDCHVQGLVSGDMHVGGLVGKTYSGQISQCSSNVLVKGKKYLGGLTGWAEWGYINGCSSHGSVNGDNGGERVGGLIGYNGNADVFLCWSTATVHADNADNLGGLIGYHQQGSIINCFSRGSVNGGDAVGGLVGHYNNAISGNGILNCYSAGLVTGIDQTGGLVGDISTNDPNIIAVHNSFWDVNLSDQIFSAGGTGLTPSEMMDVNVYLTAGWDFVGESENGLHDIWMMSEEDGYPELTDVDDHTLPALNGSGTAEDPYLISSANDLKSLLYGDLYAHYQLTNDIDLKDIQWTRAVIPNFYGVFDGNNYEIQNMNIVGHKFLGFFGVLGVNAEVCNLHIVQANVMATGNVVGILAGYNSGSIINCHTSGSGSVTGNIVVGGLIGYCYYDTVLDCSSDGMVIGNDHAGKLIGYRNLGSVTNCRSTSLVNGQQVDKLWGYYNKGTSGIIVIVYQC